MTSRPILPLFLLLLAVPVAAAAPVWSDVSLKAQRLDSLGPFLERYVGRCQDPELRADCEQNVRTTRRSLDGKVYTANVGEQTLEIVRPERTAAGYRYVVTPFIDGGGLALTHGEPRQQDSSGRPLIGLVVLNGPLPAGMDELALESALRTGRIELQVAFRPEGTWRLKRKGSSGYYEGVKARFVALRLVESRTGAEIASKVFADSK
jgi:hypothetical protein